jgi:hypothetical protein
MDRLRLAPTDLFENSHFPRVPRPAPLELRRRPSVDGCAGRNGDNK